MKISEKNRDHLIVAGICLIIFLVIVRDYFGFKRVGSFYERSSAYEVEYIVNLFPENHEAKNYRITGLISRPEGDCDDEEGGGCTRATFLEEIYWPNGGTTHFDDCELEKETEGSCFDNNKRYWKIELLKPTSKYRQ